MLKRGDAQHHVAAYFGFDSRAVSHINTRKTFGSVPAASATALPPPGPYRPDPIYVAFYQEMARVNQLWNERKLKEAKARLERALRSPAIPLEQSAIERSEEHTSELQSLMRISYAVFCLKKKKN